MKKILTVLVMVFGFMMIPNITSAQTTEISTASVDTEGTFNFPKRVRITSKAEVEKIIDLLVSDKPILKKDRITNADIEKSVNNRDEILASFKYYIILNGEKRFYRLTYHKNLKTGKFYYDYGEI